MDYLFSEDSNVPITALCSYTGYIIAGEGPCVRIYHQSHVNPLSTHRVFPSQAVHGIVCDSNSLVGGILLIWGGPLVRVVSVLPRNTHSSPPQLCLGPLLSASDWILCLQFAPSSRALTGLPSDDTPTITAGLVTAHNALYCISIYKPEKGSSRSPSVPSLQASLDELTSNCRCILYSAHLLWLHPNRILVASGTVFGEIPVWSCDLAPKGCGRGFTSSNAQLHYVLTGHDGSVFGVHISSDVTLPNHHGTKRLLASCSDDRTIRIWDITRMPSVGGSIDPHYIADVTQPGETGSDSKPVTLLHPCNNRDCLAVAWGHASRIWSVRFLEALATTQEVSQPMRLVSRGEDGTCQLWTIDAAVSGSKTVSHDASLLSLKHETTFAKHNGKNLWSMTTALSSGKLAYVITGGADGSIVTCMDHAWSLPHQAGQIVEEHWQIDPALQTADGQDLDVSFSVVPGQDAGEVLHTYCSLQGKRCSQVEDSQFSYGTLPVTHGNDNATVAASKSGATKGVHKDAFKSYAFLRGGELIITSHAGVVLHAHIKKRIDSIKETHVNWRKLGQFDKLISYSVSTSVELQDIAFVAGPTGVVLCYDNISRSIFELHSSNGKVAGLFAQELTDVNASDLAPLPSTKASMIILLVTCVGRDTADILTLNITSQSVGRSISVQNALSLQLPPEFVVTSLAAKVTDGSRRMLCVGARNGHVGSCLLEPSIPVTQDSEQLRKVTLQLFEDRIADDAITSLTWMSPRTGSDTDLPKYLISTSRDGTYAVQKLVRLWSALEANSSTIVYRSTLPFGSNIEGAHVTENGHLLFYGFRSKQFVVWDETDHNEIITVECGGAHRNWAFQPLVSVDGCVGGTFVWTQKADMQIYSITASSHQVIKRGGHGREIKAVAVCPSIEGGQVGKRYFATGAEDTDIRIFELPSAPRGGQTSSFRCVRIVKKHNTGIQHLQWSEDGRFLFSSGGFEEFFVWRIRRVPIIDIGVVCESVCPPQNVLPDLRITSFVAREIAPSKSRHEDDVAFMISMVYSDSSVRVYRYTSTHAASHWTLLLAGHYLSSCLMQCTYLSQPAFPAILTAGTDGRIALWDLHVPQDLGVSISASMTPSNIFPSCPGTLQWHTRHKIHQNTIKCLTHTQLNSSTYLLLTGGDDNALAITLLRLHPGLHASARATCSTLLIPRAHAAAITGVSLIPIPSRTSPAHFDHQLPNRDNSPTNSTKTNPRSGDHTSTFYATTASNDQRLKVWVICVDERKPGVEGVEIRRLANKYTPVADIADMDLWWDGNGDEGAWRVLLVGVGMENWNVGGGDKRGEKGLD